ncbi:hypothetical protein LUZ61_017955 [Rhynchospora tenuis]|uniref:Uncharacterized protein n=1 Tax=Rhynchospora tenuis TaxID=198213 RepID=A0AAD5Z8E3_9POAL|nr:hypothetical protein LUZ61_017955 [Rhynchospora tenuis]
MAILKLFIEKKNKKVLFAEASNDVVDFLFNLLSLPIGSVTKLLSKESMVGCLGATYGSLKKLPKHYQCWGARDGKPCCQPNSKAIYVTDFDGSRCPVCKQQMTMEVWYKGGGKGFVEDTVSYIITDELSVLPMSKTSTTTLLSQFSVKDVSCLEKRKVSFGHKEAAGLLKASLQSKTALTDLFLRN